MIGLRYEGEMLDVKPDAALSFELNNMVFAKADSSNLLGSFSFPYTLPATPQNLALLQHPNRVDNAGQFREGTVSVYFQGKALFPGTMKVRKASDSGIDVYIVVNPLNELKKTPLNELDLGGERTWPFSLLEHALDTANDPLDYDYVFFPVYNRALWEELLTDGRSWFQNFYHTGTQEFQAENQYPGLTPFIRLEYLLQQIFSGQDYAFENRFQVTEELRQICLYNNSIAWFVNTQPSSFNLQNHVSKTAASAFVRKIVGSFCLGLFYNTWEKVLRLVPLEALLHAEPAYNWTAKLLEPVAIEPNADHPDYLRWKPLEDDSAWEYNAAFPYPEGETLLGAVDWADLPAQADGLWYITDKHSYYRKASSTYTFVHTTLGSAPPGVLTGKSFDAEAQALWDIFLISQDVETFPSGADFDLVPHAEVPARARYVFTDGAGTRYVTQTAEILDRLTIYRGMQPCPAGPLYPLASGIPWNAAGDLVGQYSLRWDGEYGMYESWWKSWHTMLSQGKRVTARVMLTISDVIEFDFRNKVRIGNMDYFVKRLRINMTPRGLAPVDVELVSVI